MSDAKRRRAATLPYVPELDGLRAVALLAVIGVHTAQNIMPGAYIGVDVFFVLSGFLITRILITEFEATGHINFLNFYARRGLRLMPALWLFLLVWVVVAILHGGEKEHDHLWAALSAGLYFMNWTRAFDIGPSGSVGHTWSLAVEEQFYLVWPPLLLLALTRVNRSSVWLPTLALLVASSAWRAFLIYAGADEDRVYNGFDTRAETLLFGCLLAVLPMARWASFGRRLWFVPVGCLLLCVFFLPIVDNGNPGKVWKLVFTVGFSVVAGCAAWVIMLIYEYRSVLHIPVLSWKPMVYLGRISYGVYLWHYPINLLLKPHLPGPVNFAVTTASSVVIATASFQLIEARALRLKRRFVPTVPA